MQEDARPVALRLVLQRLAVAAREAAHEVRCREERCAHLLALHELVHAAGLVPGPELLEVHVAALVRVGAAVPTVRASLGLAG